MPTADAAAADQPPSYRFKPSLAGPVWEFRLAPDALEWQAGRRTGRAAFATIRRLRLSFRPMTTQSYRFLTEIWPPAGPRLRIASSSWSGIAQQERHDAAYSEFVAELHRRLVAAQPQLRCQRGTAPLAYWPGLAVFIAIDLALVWLILRALQTQAWAGAATVAGFLAVFLWQAGTFFRHNRPGIYEPASPPAEMLPG